MKYFKITVTLFIISLCLTLVGVDAREYTQLINIKIPTWGNTFTSSTVDKDNDWEYTQKVKKTAISDDLTGDGRAVLGQIRGVLTGMGKTDWKNLPLGQNIDFGEGTEVEGPWVLSLKSDKSLPTTATASFNWDLGTISYSPYPIKGTRE